MKHFFQTAFALTALFLVVGLLPISPLPGEASAFSIIVNKTVPDKSLSKEDIKKVFLGKKIKWDDGSRINVAVMSDGDAHQELVKEYVQRSAAQFTVWWRRQVFTGRGSFPKTFSSEADMIKYVAETDGAVGYISSNVATDKVKTLAITD